MAPSKKRMIWTITALSIVIVGAVVLSFFALQWMGEQNMGKAAEKETTVHLATDEITAQVIEQMGYKELSKTEKSQISKHYVMPEGLVADSTVYVAKSSESAFEIACFEVADINYMPQLDAVIADHMAQRASGFKNSPQEYAFLQKYTLAHSGVYAFVAVAENAAAAETAFLNITGQR